MATTTIKIWTAESDSSTSRYDSIATSSIAGFTNPSSLVVYVMGAFKTPVIEGDEILLIDGEKLGPVHLRHTFPVQCKTFSYHASLWDLNDYDDVEAMIRKIQKNQLCWLELTEIGNALSISKAYHAANYAIPVSLVGLSFEDNGEGGKEITMNFDKKYREL